jgi:flagellar assembly factor FliW
VVQLPDLSLCFENFLVVCHYHHEMPKLDTRQFGTIDFADESVLDFPCGMPAFEQHTRFLLIEKDSFAPFLFLQSVIDGQVSFLVLPVAQIDPAYQSTLEPEDLELLGVGDTLDPLVTLAVVTLVPGGTPTANLVAPILIHMEHRKGVQSIQTASGYSHQTPLRREEGRC